MSIVSDLRKRIEKKNEERWLLQDRLDRLQAEAQALDAVITELESVLKVAEKQEAGNAQPEIKLRLGSEVYRSREVLRRMKQPAEIGELLKALGKEDTQENRRSLSSQLAWYARKDQIFTRPEPGMWGLLEWIDNAVDSTTESDAELEALPLRLEDIQDPDETVPTR